VPFLNITLPVGAGTPEAPVTVAVKVTLESTAIEVAEAVSAVVVAPKVTVTISEVDTEATFLLSPP
jgi:hypothetical protein